MQQMACAPERPGLNMVESVWDYIRVRLVLQDAICMLKNWVLGEEQVLFQRQRLVKTKHRFLFSTFKTNSKVTKTFAQYAKFIFSFFFNVEILQTSSSSHFQQSIQTWPESNNE